MQGLARRQGLSDILALERFGGLQISRFAGIAVPPRRVELDYFILEKQMPADDGKALSNMSLSNHAVQLREATPHAAGSRAGNSNRRTRVSEESRRLAESIVTSLRRLGLECELIDLMDQTH